MNLPPEALYALIGAGIGGLFAILGGIVGGWMQGLAWYHYESKRARGERRQKWIKVAQEWASNGHKESLRRADLIEADLRGVKLGSQHNSEMGADLSYGCLDGANLEGAHLYRTDFEGASLEKARLVRSRLSGAHLWFANLADANLESAILGSDYDTTNPTLDEDGRMQPELIWSAARLLQADLSHSNLSKAQLREVQLVSAIMKNAKLVGADMVGASLRDANLQGADLSGANLDRADLRGARLKGAKLKGVKMKGAEYNKATVWPRGYIPPSDAIKMDE